MATETFMSGISNETLLALLGVLFVFSAMLIGIIGWFVHRTIIRDLKRKSEEGWRKERNISMADTSVALGYFHMRLYKIVCQEKTEPEDEDGKAKKEIDNALAKIQKAVEFLKGIEEEKCLRQIFVTKNNYAYYLARKWNYYRYHRDTDKKIKRRDNDSFKEYLEKIGKAKEYNGDKRIAEGNIEYLKNKKTSEICPDLSQHLEDTYAWVKQTLSIDLEIKMESEIKNK